MGTIKFFAVASLFLLHVVHTAPIIEKKRDPLVVIMLDGFRWDYLDQQSSDVLPGFTSFLQEGVRAKWVEPVFPSHSFPSLTTIATGLYPENHGIVGNFMYDKEHERHFSLYDSISQTEPQWWQGAEPIWVTATHEGCTAALYLWSRCDVKINETLPAFCTPFEEKHGWEVLDRNLQQAVENLKNGFDLVQVYYQFLDLSGHWYGPESDLMKQAVRDVDAVLIKFLRRLETENLIDKVNIVFVSDHGMTTTDPESTRYLSITDYLDEDDVEVMLDAGAYINILPKEGRTEKIYRDLQRMPKVRVAKKHELPERFHFNDSSLIHDIIVVADKGTAVRASAISSLPRMDPDWVMTGNHGYDPADPDMRTIFFARGPDFKNNYIHRYIELVDVYNILAHVLRIPERPNNGSWDNVKGMFTRPYRLQALPQSPIMIIAPIMFLSLLTHI